MAVKINGVLLCEYCFAPLKKHESCACGGHGERRPGALPLGVELDRRYIVGQVLGKGGFGVTYLCYDKLLNVRTAIKEYMPGGICCRDSSGIRMSVADADRETFRRGAVRVMEEADTIRLFNGNPNIISVNGYFKENNTVYYVMEYLEGCDLRAYMKTHGLLSESDAAFIAAQVLHALTIVHSRHILHRDISPDNIFICTDGNIKLIDFGAAKQLVGSETQLLSMVLKQGFAPAEQYQTGAKQQGPWTDIYALGASMYYCLTGRLPSDALTRLSGDDMDFSMFSPGMSRILQKAMAVQVSGRFRSAAEMLEEVERLPMTDLDGHGGAQELSGHIHRFNPVITLPGCGTAGFTRHVCRCGMSFTDSFTPPSGHLWSDWSGGERICRRCGCIQYAEA